MSIDKILKVKNKDFYDIINTLNSLQSFIIKNKYNNFNNINLYKFLAQAFDPTLPNSVHIKGLAVIHHLLKNSEEILENNGFNLYLGSILLLYPYSNISVKKEILNIFTKYIMPNKQIVTDSFVQITIAFMGDDDLSTLTTEIYNIIKYYMDCETFNNKLYTSMIISKNNNVLKYLKNVKLEQHELLESAIENLLKTNDIVILRDTLDMLPLYYPNILHINKEIVINVLLLLLKLDKSLNKRIMVWFNNMDLDILQNIIINSTNTKKFELVLFLKNNNLLQNINDGLIIYLIENIYLNPIIINHILDLRNISKYTHLILKNISKYNSYNINGLHVEIEEYLINNNILDPLPYLKYLNNPSLKIIKKIINNDNELIKYLLDTIKLNNIDKNKTFKYFSKLKGLPIETTCLIINEYINMNYKNCELMLSLLWNKHILNNYLIVLPLINTLYNINQKIKLVVFDNIMHNRYVDLLWKNNNYKDYKFTNFILSSYKVDVITKKIKTFILHNPSTTEFFVNMLYSNNSCILEALTYFANIDLNINYININNYNTSIFTNVNNFSDFILCLLIKVYDNNNEHKYTISKLVSHILLKYGTNNIKIIQDYFIKCALFDNITYNYVIDILLYTINNTKIIPSIMYTHLFLQKLENELYENGSVWEKLITNNMFLECYLNITDIIQCYIQARKTDVYIINILLNSAIAKNIKPLTLINYTIENNLLNENTINILKDYKLDMIDSVLKYNNNIIKLSPILVLESISYYIKTNNYDINVLKMVHDYVHDNSTLYHSKIFDILYNVKTFDIIIFKILHKLRTNNFAKIFSKFVKKINFNNNTYTYICNNIIDLFIIFKISFPLSLTELIIKNSNYDIISAQIFVVNYLLCDTFSDTSKKDLCKLAYKLIFAKDFIDNVNGSFLNKLYEFYPEFLNIIIKKNCEENIKIFEKIIINLQNIKQRTIIDFIIKILNSELSSFAYKLLKVFYIKYNDNIIKDSVVLLSFINIDFYNNPPHKEDFIDFCKKNNIKDFRQIEWLYNKKLN